MSPEMRRKVDATRAQRLAAESAVRQQMQAQNQVSLLLSPTDYTLLMLYLLSS